MPDQLLDGFRLGTGTHADTSKAERVFLAGMGGSAIAGDIFRSWATNRARLPIQVVRDYRLPSYATPGDVLVAVSYSGTTEETLAATAQAVKLGCRIVAVTSGGRLAALVQEAGGPTIRVPPGLPPRGAFGLLFGILAAVGEEWVYGDLRGELERAVVHLKDLRGRLGPSVPLATNRAKAHAKRLRNRTPVVYAAPPLTAVAKRWQTQLNENAKVLAFASEFPEADHNEIVGWCSDASARRFVPIMLRDADETPEMRHRLDVTEGLVGRHARVDRIEDDDDELLGRLLGLLFLGDYVSLYLAALRGVDPTPVKAIDELKARLAAPARRRKK